MPIVLIFFSCYIYLCGFLSQLCTGNISLYQVLHGISLVTLPLGLGASAVPTKLNMSPVPSGNGKNIEPCNHSNVQHEISSLRFQTFVHNLSTRMITLLDTYNRM